MRSGVKGGGEENSQITATTSGQDRVADGEIAFSWKHTAATGH